MHSAIEFFFCRDLNKILFILAAAEIIDYYTTHLLCILLSLHSSIKEITSFYNDKPASFMCLMQLHVSEKKYCPLHSSAADKLHVYLIIYLTKNQVPYSF